MQYANHMHSSMYIKVIYLPVFFMYVNAFFQKIKFGLRPKKGENLFVLKQVFAASR